LFIGPEGTGKRTAARWFANALCCTPAETVSTHQAVESDPAHGPPPTAHSPDYHRIGPEAGRKSIGIDAARALVALASRRPFLAPYQVMEIAPAEAMTVEAANCLLKTLEEPSPQTILVLISARAADLLPTILSRCQLVPFGLVPTDALRDFLATRGVSPDLAADAAHRARGRFDLALALASASRVATPSAFPRDAVEATRLAEAWLATEEVPQREARLQELQQRCHQRLLAGAEPPRPLLRRVARLEAAQALLAGHVNAKLVLEATLRGLVYDET
jgi:DNA polymerase-3 subunit delta'